jgi:thioredoxin 1
MSNAIAKVTDATFETEVLGASLPVLVDYWAEWCGPCKMIAPMLEESAASYAGRLSLAKLNVDENPKAPSQYHIRSIPTLMLFKGGQPVATKVGALSKSQLAAFIEENL